MEEQVQSICERTQKLLHTANRTGMDLDQFRAIKAYAQDGRAERRGRMKVERKHDYSIPGYGTVMFVKADLGSGHWSYKVFWRKEGAEKGTRIAWMQEGRKPSAELAVFYCKMACAIEDGVDQYYYHDKGLTPPKRVVSQMRVA